VYPNTPTPKAPLLSPHPLQKETFSPPLLTASTSNVTTEKITPRHRCRAAPLSPPQSRSDTPCGPLRHSVAISKRPEDQRFFRCCRAAPSPAPLRSRSTGAKATRGDRCSSSEAGSRMESHHRRCTRFTRLTWRLGCALRNFLSLLNRGFLQVVRLRTWRTGATSAWAGTSIVLCSERHRF
jgi:hypothetical protein